MPVRQELWKVSLSCAPAFVNAVEEFLGDAVLSFSVVAPPRHKTALVEALYGHEPDVAALNAQIALLAVAHKTLIPSLQVAPVGNLDWLKKVASDFPPLAIARWTIYGAAHKNAVVDRKNKLQIDATSAFGTGEHPTTRGCLLMLDKILRHSAFSLRGMLDIGCGSGILAMAFAQAARCPAVAVDLDPDSVVIARNNARANGLDDLVAVARSRGYLSPLIKKNAPYDLIMANIFARPLCEMAKDLGRHLAPGGVAILSGILNHQANAVLSAHRQQGLFLLNHLKLCEWSVLVLQRRDSCYAHATVI